HYNGQQWERMDPGVTNSDSVTAIHGRHSRDIYLAATNGKISYNNGFCWSPVPTTASTTFRAIWLQKSNEIYAAGDTGLLAQSDGQAVTIIDPIVFGNYSDIDGGADYVIATGSYENIIRYASVISIPDQTLYADSLVHSIPFVVNDPDGDSVTVSVTPSSLTLLSADSISISGTEHSYALLITPTVHASLPITITISAYDGNITQNENFMLYLRKMNEPPELAIIPNIGTAAGEISFTFVETDGDTVSLTVTSSDQSLINDAGIQIVGGTGNTILLPTTAYVEQNVSIQLNQESNAHGLATITVEASATGGTVTETFNVIVSPPGSGNALAFDGEDDFVTFGAISGSHPLALAGSQFSMSFWIKPAFNNSVSQRLIDKSTNTYGADGYSLYLYSGYRLKFALNGLDRFTTEENSLKPNLWQHVVITADASQYKCYVNGMTVGLTILDAFELPPSVTANLHFGTWYSESGREYNGEMDEVSLWNRALSETDIRNIMCQRLIGTESGLLAYYRFDHVSGTVLSDLSGNNYNGTLTNMDNTDWVTSGAALGDSSHYDYNGSVASDFSVTLSHSDGDAFTAVGDSGSYSGLQIYLVNEPPSAYTAPAGFSGVYTDHYFGVFPVGITPTYSIAYNYTGHSSIVDDINLRLVSRSNNAGLTWTDSGALLDSASTTLSKTGISAFTGISTTEFMPGINYIPSIESITDQITNEDTTVNVPISITDTETSTCSLNISFATSDASLISVTNIAYTCTANTIYLSLTPSANQSGYLSITAYVADEGGQTAETSFGITINAVNDPPVIGTINGQVMDEDTTINTITFTASDVDSSACGLTVNFASSNSSLITDITAVCNNDNYTITAIPLPDQNGIATITVTVTNSIGVTAATSFDLTVTNINDVPVFTSTPGLTATEDQPYNYTLTAIDTDNDTLTYTITVGPSWLAKSYVSFDIDTYAGTGTPGSSGDGGLATSAQLNNPVGVAVDSSGNLYISGMSSSKIRKVDKVTGIISTVAGTGSTGYSGDGGPATSAQLYYPYLIAFDSNDDLFIADSYNSCIRKIDISTGIISTVAGKGSSNADAIPATQAIMTRPYGIAFDSSDNMYIADNFEDIIRKVDNSTGYIYTIAGTGTGGYSGDGGNALSAQIHEPIGIVISSSNILYFSDYNNGKVRQIDLSTNIISHVATLSQSIDVGLDSSENLYISWATVDIIKKIDITTGAETTMAGLYGNGGYSGDGGSALDAQIDGPQGLAFDNNDNVYFADSSNHVIRILTPSSTKISGSPLNEHGGDNFVTVEVSDGTVSITQSFTITVANVNDAPVALASSFTVTEDSSANQYTLTATDEESDALTFSLVSNPTKGSLTIIDASSGACVYTPNADEFGEDTFTFKVNDGEYDSITATVTVNIIAVEDSPVITSQALTTATEDQPYNYTLIASDADGDT
ncbi:MAG: hypothetical protein OMM_10009, partial [Candidatus Magnetoglobus multicellularis str. Araruama]